MRNCVTEGLGGRDAVCEHVWNSANIPLTRIYLTGGLEALWHVPCGGVFFRPDVTDHTAPGYSIFSIRCRLEASHPIRRCIRIANPTHDQGSHACTNDLTGVCNFRNPAYAGPRRGGRLQASESAEYITT